MALQGVFHSQSSESRNCDDGATALNPLRDCPQMERITSEEVILSRFEAVRTKRRTDRPVLGKIGALASTRNNPGNRAISRNLERREP